MSNEFLKHLDTVIHNPSLIQRVALGYLSHVHEGRVKFIDPSNPFVELMEASAHLTSAAISRFEVGDRKLHAIAAVEPEDVYLHMTDRDYLDRFAQPVRAPFMFVFNLDELLAKMVLDPETGYRKVVLPRNTTVTVAGMTFSLVYPIEIRELRHGGRSAVYVVDEIDPMHPLETNQIELLYSGADGVQYVSFWAELVQYEIVSLTETIAGSMARPTTKTLTDHFYYARVYRETESGWQELKTTHAEQIYDPHDPTAVIKVIGKEVTVTIPMIYILNEQVVGRIRIDLYQTKGVVHTDLGALEMEQFEVSWAKAQRADQSPFSAVLTSLETLRVFSDRLVVGGREPLSLEALRERVIANTTGPKNRPITPDQIRVSLIDRGYTIVKNIDNLTQRIFLASRLLPAPSSDRLITAASLSIQSVVFNMQEALDTQAAVDNGKSVTLLSDMVYRNQGGVTKFVSQAEVQALRNLPGEQFALKVNEQSLYYSPFHYVLDYTQLNEFDVRVYYLDAPSALSKMFVRENSSTHLSVSTDAYALERTASGYKLTIVTKSDAAFKALDDEEVHVQLSYLPTGVGNHVHLPGVLLGRDENEERIFEFHLETTYYVDGDDRIELNCFYDGDDIVRRTVADLTQEIDIIYATTTTLTHPDWEPSLIDQYFGNYLVTGRAMAINQERLRVRFGKALRHLWSRNRNLAGAARYETHEFDVPATYRENVYELDPVTGTPLQIVDGEVQFKLLHAKGDPVLDDDGLPVYLHRKGDIKHDAQGLPVLLSERKIHNQLDIMMIDAAYLFSTDPVSKAYRTEVNELITQWVTEDIDSITPSLLEKTRIYFYPTTTTGLVEVMYGSGHLTSINAAQSFRVELHVNGVTYADEPLKQQLRMVTIRTINEYLDREVVSMSEITNQLRSVYGGDVIDVRVTGLGGRDNNFPVVSITNETDRLSIGKKLVNRSDGVLVVEEDITIDFIRHGLEAYDR